MDAARIENTESLLHDLASSRGQYKTFVSVSRSKEGAQALVDNIQYWLDARENGHSLWRPAVYLLYQLMARYLIIPGSLRIPSGELSFRRQTSILDRGGVSTVYCGTWNGSSVAIKQIHPPLQAQHTLFREIVTWKQLHHRHILPFLAITTDPINPDGYLLVSPRMLFNLAAYVKPGKDLSAHTTPRGFCAHRDRERVIGEIAQGLAYLHARKVVHGDIKASNILVSSTYEIKIADFGLSLIDDATTGAGQGSLGWRAPESFLNAGTHRQATADVFAFACICYMVITGAAPFERYVRNGTYKDVVAKQKVRRNPLQPAACLGGVAVPDLLWEVIDRCWRTRPEIRLTMEHVTKCLDIDPESYRPKQDEPLFSIRTIRSHKRDDKFDDDISYGVGDIFEVLDCQQSCWLVRNSRGLLANVSSDDLEDPSLVRVQALENFSATAPGQLSFQKDEWLHIVGFGQEEWTARNHQNKTGLVPAKILKPSWSRGREDTVETKGLVNYTQHRFSFHLLFREQQLMQLIKRPPNSSYFIAELDGNIGIVPAYAVAVNISTGS